MDEGSPRARPAAVLLVFALLALQVVARYRWGFLEEKHWQAVHIALGYGVVSGALVLFHGAGVLRRFGRRELFVLGGGAALFLVFWYVGRMDSWSRWWAPLAGDPRGGGPMAPLYGFFYFSGSAFVFRTLLPFGLAFLLFRLRPSDLGLFAPGNPHPPSVRRIWPVYLLLYVAVLPFVLHAAGTAPFLAKYPMCRAMIGPGGEIDAFHFFLYEAAYLLIFVSGESFWRGFLLFGLERSLGLWSLVFMIVPYVTGHFGKPLPETLGALAAGTILAWLALKHRSVWLGVALHYAVALTMDLLAIAAAGYRFT